MPRFRYRALNSAGAVVRGVVEASDATSAARILSNRGVSLVDVRKEASGLFARRGDRRLTRSEQLKFTRQLATLLSAGVTLLEAFETLAKGPETSSVAVRSKAVRRKLRAGARLSAALEEAIPELPGFIFRLAELGENTGDLASALKDAASRLEFEQRTREEMRSALTYPVFLLSVGTLVVLGMFLFVVPRFETIITQQGAEPPLISRVVIGFGLWFSDNWLTALAAIAGLVLIVPILMRTERGQRAIEQALHRMPLVGRYLLTTQLARWARTVGLALKNGAGLMDGLKLGEAGVSGQATRSELRAVRAAVRSGTPLDDALSGSHLGAGDDMIDLVRTGRSSGRMSEMLLFISEIYEEENQRLSKRLTALLEPVTILVISGFVAVIVISIVLAMTSIYDTGL